MSKIKDVISIPMSDIEGKEAKNFSDFFADLESYFQNEIVAYRKRLPENEEIGIKIYSVAIDTSWNDSFFCIKIERDETKRERDTRLRRWEALKEEQLKEERETYEKLKKKFEGK
jgi:hypothetical protein